MPSTTQFIVFFDAPLSSSCRAAQLAKAGSFDSGQAQCAWLCFAELKGTTTKQANDKSRLPPMWRLFFVNRPVPTFRQGYKLWQAILVPGANADVVTFKNDSTAQSIIGVAANGDSAVMPFSDVPWAYADAGNALTVNSGRPRPR